MRNVVDDALRRSGNWWERLRFNLIWEMLQSIFHHDEALLPTEFKLVRRQEVAKPELISVALRELIGFQIHLHTPHLDSIFTIFQTTPCPQSKMVGQT